ncbi:uracil-DNA glycosylase [Actinocatenispora rupis]|uniref:uracil-DNA glycosylase n=1 Tax=Actinocatenispora rupis TaxID=519421 RepID=UPI0019443ED1|nr:uracil-DNA glycosylase [Actinocatenispora rupis]
MAVDAADTVTLAAGAVDVPGLDGRVSVCRACPRLVSWRERVAVEKRASFADQTYWGRPVPGFGPADARIVILGLAPAANGANRTGRMFTGDRSGDVLYAALHRAGLASAPTATSADDGLTLYGTRIFSAVRCAPPANKPTPAERDACLPWQVREFELLRPSVRVVLALGKFAWDAYWRIGAAGLGEPVPRPRPAFGHGAEYVGETITLLGCYHVSQQNTFTGTLTPTMLDQVLARARELAS